AFLSLIAAATVDRLIADGHAMGAGAQAAGARRAADVVRGRLLIARGGGGGGRVHVARLLADVARLIERPRGVHVVGVVLVTQVVGFFEQFADEVFKVGLNDGAAFVAGQVAGVGERLV